MARVTKLFKPIIHIFIFSLVSYILNKDSIKSVKKVERFLTDMKHLLLWTKLPGIEGEGQQIFIKNKCPNINCYLTINRSLLGDLRYFDAIIFNVHDVYRQDWDLPAVRNQLQKYIFAAQESADEYPVCSEYYNFFFNWTWTYRMDSSIPYKLLSVYSAQHQELGNNVRWMYAKHMKPISKHLKGSLQTKSKAAAIFLDKCKSISKREVFLKKLKEELTIYNLTIDVYGNCGNLKCDNNQMDLCYYRLQRTYYFYLALESSISLDYITDAVLYGYDYNAIPIVYGGAEYSRFLPPNSYLDARELGVKALAKTMSIIIRNKEMFYDFFRWKHYYQIKKAPGMNVCSLCDYLNNPKWLKVISYYANFRAWWHPEFRRRCRS